MTSSNLITSAKNLFPNEVLGVTTSETLGLESQCVFGGTQFSSQHVPVEHLWESRGHRWRFLVHPLFMSYPPTPLLYGIPHSLRCTSLQPLFVEWIMVCQSWDYIRNSQRWKTDHFLIQAEDIGCAKVLRQERALSLWSSKSR